MRVIVVAGARPNFIKIAPHADFLIFSSVGAQASKIHGGNESVDPAELERITVAETLFLEGLVS